MKVLVIGGTRFVGLRLVRFLANQGHDITLLNRGKAKAQLPDGLKRLFVDRRDSSAIKSALLDNSFDVVFDMTGYQLKNLEPLVSILNGKTGHYVFQSTCGVYAESEIFPILEDFPYVQMAGSSVSSAYELNKIECEEYLFKAHRETGFPVTILRCPVVYGPENWMDEREGSYFVRLLQGRKILVPGNGSTIIQLTYVDDLARAHLAVVGQQQTFGQAYNIADAQAITINEYLDIIAKIVGKDIKKIYLEPREIKKLKRSIFPFTWEKNSFFGIQKAKEHFGFWPNYDLKNGLENTYRWWTKERGLDRIRFVPGELGYDVDLAYEEEVIKKYI